MKNPIKVRKQELKKALKTLNFWYQVLLESEYMNDIANRLEFQDALRTIKKNK
jgi:hypothetical protein